MITPCKRLVRIIKESLYHMHKVAAAAAAAECVNYDQQQKLVK